MGTSSIYNFQPVAVNDAANFVASAKPGERRLYASPTGTGKSYMELALQSKLHAAGVDAWIVTPSVEIGLGMLEKLGVPDDERRVETMYARHITTPIVMRNRLLKGEWPAPDALIVDQAGRRLHRVALPWYAAGHG